MRPANIAIPILTMIGSVALFVVVGYFSAQTFVGGHQNTNTSLTACTEEAKICSDGTVVTRSGPNCEFAACPEANTNPIGNTNTIVKEPTVRDGCVVTGCSSQICSDVEVASTCEYKSEYGCYSIQTAVCEQQTNGACGWTQSEELVTCIENYTIPSTQDVLGIEDEIGVQSGTVNY